MSTERAAQLILDLTNASRRAARAGDRSKADAYRYAAWLTRQAIKDGAA